MNDWLQLHTGYYFRFLQYAPSEKIARLLRHDKTLLLEENFEEFSTNTDTDGYIIADYGRETIDKNIKETCGVWNRMYC